MVEDELFRAPLGEEAGEGPRYLQLARHLASGIAAGRLRPQMQLPPERELALLAGVSRVTVRKAMARLVADGLVTARRGAGTFVTGGRPKMEHRLSSLLSFTEYMRARGKASSSRVLRSGVFAPSPDEVVLFGLAAGERVARVDRLRLGEGGPLALEWSSLPTDVLPDPAAVATSLYDVLRSRGRAPSRAVQRISAVTVEGEEARLLQLAEGAAVLRIDRTAFLASGRPIEFTRGLYRSDVYDFVAEMREAAPEDRQGAEGPGPG